MLLHFAWELGLGTDAGKRAVIRGRTQPPRAREAGKHDMMALSATSSRCLLQPGPIRCPSRLRLNAMELVEDMAHLVYYGLL